MASDAEVDKLRDALQKPTFRRKFADENPSAAMEEEEIDEAQIPAGLLETLTGLSRHELGLVARVTHELEVEGLIGEPVMMRIPL